MVQIFVGKSRTRRTLGCHQIQIFHHRSEQLVGQEARREFKEASAHILAVEASPKAKHWPSRLTVARLHCRSSSIKVSIIEFPSSLWSRRSKPHRKLTTATQENSNSGELPCSAVTRHREREPAPPPARASRLDRRISDERPRLESGITVCLVQSEPSIRKPTAGV
jgi:hypothetical protein